MPRSMRATATRASGDAKRLCAWSMLALAITVTAFAMPMAAAYAEPPSTTRASDSAHRLAAWVMQTHDNHGLGFVIVDKVNAEALAYDAHGVLLGAAPVLLGAAHGDDSATGIGERTLANIPPNMRITPTGRFVAALGVNLAGHDVLWVDYDTALSMHPVVPGTPVEHRAQRLSSPTALDNRISFGCINVPPAFFEGVVRPLFHGGNGIVYILPETRTLDAVFFPPEGNANTSQ